MSTQLTTADGSGRMFDRIAGRYDFLNRVLSLGLDQSWRRKLVAAMPDDSAALLDVATGTGDVALALAKAYPAAQITGLDPSVNMLEVGRTKVAGLALEARVALVEGDAQAMAFEDDQFDGATIAFGIRNVPDRLQGLREMRRVVRPGGPVVILELGQPRGGFLAPFARFHLRHIVPRLGAWISGDKEYRYLQESVTAFPPPETFAALMTEAGFSDVRFERMTFDAAHLYVGVA
jgi:demethylmenaquinone methyltransferase/2-methoxy-6-polyprenyl-1,4-benzoquinol methylase